MRVVFEFLFVLVMLTAWLGLINFLFPGWWKKFTGRGKK